MRSSLAALCGRFIENRDRIKSGFGWEYSYIYPVCAEIFADKRQEVSVERMKECWALLKEKNGDLLELQRNDKADSYLHDGGRQRPGAEAE